MSDPPVPADTHTWDGTHTLPNWPIAHHWDGDQLVIHTSDGDAHPHPGWLLVLWTDGLVTVASPRIAERVYGPDGLWARAAAAG